MARRISKAGEDPYAEIRELAENDLLTFAKLVNPQRLYGQIHEDVFRWWQENEGKDTLLLLPRGHQKSHCIAVWAAWMITKKPEITILYLSATSTLAESQLYAIKNILTSDIYREIWPDMINKDEGKRERWSSTAIAVDHPKRRAEQVRDMTISTAGLTTTTAGQHYDILLADDVVVPENAYTDEGRRKTSAALSQMASILNPGGFIISAGTRYHPRDQYQIWKDQKQFVFDDEDEIVGEEPVWIIKEEVVEKNGTFLWPRAIRSDGKAFGFDRRELNKIEAKYTDRVQFFSQYYNNPNDPEFDRINRERFQYYDPKFVSQKGGRWYFKERPLNVYAAIDFAFSLNKKADFTAIVVIGIDPDGQIYVLDIDRFKADKISKYFEKISHLHAKWEFKKLRAEVTAAQSLIARDLKDMITKEGMRLSIDEHRPTRHQGNKEERVAAALEHRYDNQSIWHFRGGYIPMLEEELILAKPPHDDIKDALASVVEIATPPKKVRDRSSRNNIIFHSRFGGVAHR